jgi:hypothetical protein
MDKAQTLQLISLHRQRRRRRGFLRRTPEDPLLGQVRNEDGPLLVEGVVLGHRQQVFKPVAPNFDLESTL